MKEHWNKCDYCGKFIAYSRFFSGDAVRILLFPDSEFTAETFETFCPDCFKEYGQKKCIHCGKRCGSEEGIVCQKCYNKYNPAMLADLDA